MRRAPLVLALVLLSACGDSTVVEQHVEATSGTRMMLQLFRYDDGTEQVDPSAIYDTRLHASCAPAPWIDGEQRCVPQVAEAVFADADCATPIGFHPSMAKREPTHFLGFEQVEGERVAAHLYPAGARIASATSFYLRDGESCNGPFSPPPDVITFATRSELPPQSMQQVFDRELGAGRLVLRERTTPDGLRVTGALLDRELGVTCSPSLRDDGVVCEPDGAGTASVYADADCTAPAAIVVFGAEPPAYLRAVDRAGCTTFSLPGAQVTAAYRRDGARCVRVSLGAEDRVIGLGDPVALATLERSIATVDGRRLQHEILAAPDDPDLRFVADTLVDLAIRGQCRRTQLDDEVRCLPAQLRAARVVYGTGCTFPIRVAELAVGGCTPVGFASSFADDGTPTVHAIGDPVTTTVFEFSGAGCMPYTAPPGFELRVLGPALKPDAFVAALAYGAR